MALADKDMLDRSVLSRKSWVKLSPKISQRTKIFFSLVEAIRIMLIKTYRNCCEWALSDRQSSLGLTVIADRLFLSSGLFVRSFRSTCEEGVSRRRKGAPECGGAWSADMATENTVKQTTRILVVEDEPFIAMGLEHLLPKLGYEVVGVASHLREALAKAEAGGFDLAVLDVNLGGELSYRVADVLLARAVPFLFCTAYADVAFGRYARVPVLQKPFEKKALARAIEEALGRVSPSRVA